MNKRRYQRVEVKKLVANLSDGVNSFSGTVSNISRLGVLFNDFRQRPNTLKNRLLITISAKSKDFKLQVEPKWVSRKKSENKMGLAIINPPFDWTVFAMIYEPADEDI
jgi:hypothetical protein